MSNGSLTARLKQGMDFGNGTIAEEDLIAYLKSPIALKTPRCLIDHRSVLWYRSCKRRFRRVSFTARPKQSHVESVIQREQGFRVTSDRR